MHEVKNPTYNLGKPFKTLLNESLGLSWTKRTLLNESLMLLKYCLAEHEKVKICPIRARDQGSYL